MAVSCLGCMCCQEHKHVAFQRSGDTGPSRRPSGRVGGYLCRLFSSTFFVIHLYNPHVQNNGYKPLHFVNRNRSPVSIERPVVWGHLMNLLPGVRVFCPQEPPQCCGEEQRKALDWWHTRGVDMAPRCSRKLVSILPDNIWAICFTLVWWRMYLCTGSITAEFTTL